MRIVKPSATLLTITPNAEQLIERCGRICYKSEDQITSDSAAKFIKMIVERGHHSVLEHATATILFVCDRGVSHELVRHRLASYSQESTRYCNYGKDKYGGEIAVIEPPGLDRDGTFVEKQNYHRWFDCCRATERAYLGMIDDDIPPQLARSVLLTCLKTEIATTANLREWRHILKLRTAPAAHPQIREVMEQAAALLVAECPNVFAEFEVC